MAGRKGCLLMVSKSGLSGIVLLPMMVMLMYIPQVYAAAPTVKLDGVAIGSTFDHDTRTASATLTTTNANDVIVVIAQCGIFQNCGSCCPSPSSIDNITSIVDDGGHTWTLRAAYTPQHGRPLWEYFTIAESPLSSDRISVTWSGSNPFFGFVALGISVFRL